MNNEFHESHHGETHRGRGPRGRTRGPRSHFGGGPSSGPEEMFRGGFPPRGRRQRRGDVRAAILVLLEEGPRNGYQIIQELSERSNGAWRPSPGSVYPVLAQLEDEGLITVSSTESGRSFGLTAEGTTLVSKERESLGKPWETAAAGLSDATSDLFTTLKQVAMAVRQVAMAGSDAQKQNVTTILADARRAIYRILAEDES